MNGCIEGYCDSLTVDVNVQANKQEYVARLRQLKVYFVKGVFRRKCNLSLRIWQVSQGVLARVFLLVSLQTDSGGQLSSQRGDGPLEQLSWIAGTQHDHHEKR